MVVVVIVLAIMVAVRKMIEMKVVPVAVLIVIDMADVMV